MHPSPRKTRNLDMNPSAINAENLEFVLRVRLQLDGIVLDALGLGNFSADVPKNLQITRLYQGRRVPILFDPATKDIFRLSLMPGDELVW